MRPNAGCRPFSTTCPEMEHWLQVVAFLIGEVATLLLPQLLLPRLLRAPSDAVVCPEKYCAYFGLVGIFQSVLYATLGFYGKILTQDRSQILSWVGLVSGFGLAGFALFYWAWKEKITITKNGLEFSYMFRGIRRIEWSAIVKIKKNWLGYIVIKLQTGQSIWVPEAYQNSMAILIAAVDKQIPLTGYIK